MSEYGYKGIGPNEGEFVEDDDAYGYALERCLDSSTDDHEEFRVMLVEWFYSGNWVRR